MAKAFGLCGKLQGEQVSEREIFEALAMEPGEKYLVSGAIVRGGRTFMVSHAACDHANVASIRAVELGGGVVELEVRAGSTEAFGDVSLAW